VNAPARQPSERVQLFAALELCAVFGPLTLLGLFTVPLGLAGSVSSFQRGADPLAALGSLASGLCAVAGLWAAWHVLTRLAWRAQGGWRLSRLELVGVLCGVAAAAPYLPLDGSFYLFFPFQVLPIAAAVLGVVHLYLHVREARHR
jgi:hypothetical protein